LNDVFYRDSRALTMGVSRPGTCCPLAAWCYAARVDQSVAPQVRFLRSADACRIQ